MEICPPSYIKAYAHALLCTYSGPFGREGEGERHDLESHVAFLIPFLLCLDRLRRKLWNTWVIFLLKSFPPSRTPQWAQGCPPMPPPPHPHAPASQGRTGHRCRHGSIEAVPAKCAEVDQYGDLLGVRKHLLPQAVQWGYLDLCQHNHWGMSDILCRAFRLKSGLGYSGGLLCHPCPL